MSIVKVIEIIASFEKSIEDAIQNGVSEVSKTIHNTDSVYVKDIKAHVKDGKMSSYGGFATFFFEWINSMRSTKQKKEGFSPRSFFRPV